MTFKVIDLVVEQFFAHLLNFVLKQILGQQMWNFYTFFYKYIQVTACKKIGILYLSLIKLLQNEQGCNFFCLTVYMRHRLYDALIKFRCSLTVLLHRNSVTIVSRDLSTTPEFFSFTITRAIGLHIGSRHFSTFDVDNFRRLKLKTVRQLCKTNLLVINHR